MSNEFWSQYAADSSHHNEELAKFIRDLAVSLGAKSVLEVGCSSGNDLKLFSKETDVNGIDSNGDAIRKAQQDFPDFKFKVASIADMPYKDASMDFVFTRNTLNYIPDEDMKKSFDELFRVSRKYIVNIEKFSEDDSQTSENPPMFGRNVYKHWMDFKVKIISNVDKHEEIDPKKSRFTLVRKV